MQEHAYNQSAADLEGPWEDSDWNSGLIERCRRAWNKPLRELTNEELATFLRQDIATEHVLPIAQERIKSGFDDGTEMYDGELQAAIDDAKKSI